MSGQFGKGRFRPAAQGTAIDNTHRHDSLGRMQRPHDDDGGGGSRLRPKC